MINVKTVVHVQQNVRRRLSHNKMKKTLKDGFILLKNDIEKAKWAVIFIIAYFVFGNKFLHSICPMVWITGFPCPACGLTRAGIRLLHLDFKEAWQMHPFIYVFAAGVVIFAWERYIRKKRIGKRFQILCVVCVVLMVIYYVWRMYRYFPDQPPMSYYRYNLLRNVMRCIRGLEMIR